MGFLFILLVQPLLMTACTNAAQRQAEFDCDDRDGDGATLWFCPDNGMERDCNDDPELEGASEAPGSVERNDDTLWYDGLDNDCTFNVVTAGV